MYGFNLGRVIVRDINVCCFSTGTVQVVKALTQGEEITQCARFLFSYMNAYW